MSPRLVRPDRRSCLLGLALLLAAAPVRLARAAAAPWRVAVQGFGSSTLLGPSATEESLVSLLIDELVAAGGWAVVDDSGAGGGSATAGSGSGGAGAAAPAPPPLILRGVITRFEASGGSGLDVGGIGGRFGGGGGVKSESFNLGLSLRLLDPTTRQVLAVAPGAAVAKAKGLRADIAKRNGPALGGERTQNPAVEQAVRTALREAIAKLATAARNLPG